MELKTAILDYTKYNHWANNVLTGWLKSLDVQLLYKEVPSSFPGIALTLQHINDAQNFWHAVISNANTGSLDREETTGSVDWVMEALLKGSQNLVNLVVALHNDELMIMVSSPAITKSRYEFLLHVVNHSSYHRGQIVTMARWLNITENIPNTDYDTYLWMRTTDPG